MSSGLRSPREPPRRPSLRSTHQHRRLSPLRPSQLFTGFRLPYMGGSVIVGGARTPIARFRGTLSPFAATELGAIAVRAALQRSGVPADAVDYTIMGHVLQAGAGQITARQAAISAGIPKEVPALTVNKVCL